jgi:holo-[acyl-carrier protein] synthase
MFPSSLCSSSFIHGVGCDIAAVPRFSSLLTRSDSFVNRFLQKVLHPSELQHYYSLSSSGPLRAQFIASRWAAKESFIKAFGYRVQFPQILITKNPPDPRAKMLFTAEAHDLVTFHGILNAHVSLSHEAEFSIAFVILEKNQKITKSNEIIK